MAKINFSMNAFSRTVIPGLDKTVDSLDVLINKCYQLSIPYDFKYKAYLQNLDNDFKSCKVNVIKVKDWIYKSNTTYNDIIEKIKQNSVSLNNIQIGKKYSSIK